MRVCMTRGCGREGRVKHPQGTFVSSGGVQPSFDSSLRSLLDRAGFAVRGG